MVLIAPANLASNFVLPSRYRRTASSETRR
jgi:hypothetical protein